MVLADVKQEEACARLEAIRMILDSRPDLVAAFPSLEPLPSRTRGRRRRGVDTNRELALRGGRLLAVGAGESVRGLLRESSGPDRLVRPKLVVFDDVETRDQARSRMRTDRLEEWVFAELCQLGGPPGDRDAQLVDVVGVGTTLEANCLADRALRRSGRFRTWRVGSFPAETTDVDDRRIASWEGLPLRHLDRLLDPDDSLYVGRYTYSREYLLDPERVTGTLWNAESLAASDPPTRPYVAPLLSQIVVAVDPSWGTKGDECGIVVAGLGEDGRGYVLEDASLRGTPTEWGQRVVQKYSEHGADLVLAETTFQAEQVRLVMRTVDPNVPFKEMSASRGKRVRAEPIVALYEQGRVTHVQEMPRLEAQMLEWNPETSTFSPDRVDALVWALTFLMLGATGEASFHAPSESARLDGDSWRERLTFVR